MPDMPPRPLHPLHQCTTFELSNYRGELEHAIKATPEHAAIMGALRDRLDAVLAEESARRNIRRAG
jgi:hypothetical protein